MYVGFRFKSGVALGVVAMAMVGSACGQGVTITEPNPLLPPSFGEWKTAGSAVAASDFSLANSKQAALQEAGPDRSAVADYERAEQKIHVEAIQFNDRTGAYSAFTLIAKPDMKPGKDLGAADAVGDGAVLFTAGSTLVLASGTTDAASLKPLAAVLPKIGGSKGMAPILPGMAPEKGLVAGSVRYALGPESYAAEGGVLPAKSLGWDKSAEAVTAKYDDKRGKETLTMLLYPTPAIAGNFAKFAADYTQDKGAKVRRQGELVLVAEGTFSPDEAQKMIENIHLEQQLTFDKDMPPVFEKEVTKTYSLLTNILVFSGLLMLAALLLAVFLGGGRAAIRVMRGKSAAVEPEFLSLHLNPQNAKPTFGSERVS
jgi:hypothetical protein